MASSGLTRAVRPDLDGQLVELGVLTQTRGLDRVVDLLDRRVDGVDRDVAERQVLVEVALGGDVAAPALEAHLDGERAALADGRDVDVGVENLDVGVGLDVGRGDLARAVAWWMVRVLASVPWSLNGICFRLRMTSVASSTTPRIEENSCSTPSILTAVMAAPSIEESSARRRELPMVVPKPRSNGCAEKRP